MKLLSDIGEDALVQRLTAALAQDSSVLVPPGDDCAAVLPLAAGQAQLLKTDVIVEGVHFTRDMDAALVGRKAIARAISDIAAMGGRPQHALVTLVLPRDLALDWVEGMYAGLRQMAEAYAINIVGGETSSGAQIVIAIALTGSAEAQRIALRSGGKAGDGLLVTGLLGGSFASGRHLTFEPRVEQAHWLLQHFEVHAMMDLSDGLGSDLPRLAKASGLGFVIQANYLPCAPACTPSQAWSDGEDYELLLAMSPAELTALQARWARRFPTIPLTLIGLLVADPATQTHPFQSQGWEHFKAQ